MDENDRGGFDPLRPGPLAHKTNPPPAEESDLEAASDDVRKLDRGVPPDYHKKDRNLHTPLMIAAIVLAIALVAAGSYWFLAKHKKPAAKAPATTSQSANSSSQKSAPQLINPQTKSYTSGNFGLAFDYPADWEITDSGNGSLVAKSPSLKLKDPNGQSFDGFIVMTIRDHAQKLSEFDSGNATATRDSEKLAYTKPTQSQRANTYVSYVVYAGGSGLDSVYVTGDNGYQKGQSVPAADISKVDPIINLSFLNSSGKTTGIQDAMMSDNNFAGPLKEMIESLSIN